MSSGTTAGLDAVWGSGPNDIFAVGHSFPSGNVILHHDGSSWSEMASGTTEGLYGIWGSGPNDVFAVGGSYPSGSNFLRYDGSSWSPMSGPTISLKSVWGSGTNDVFAVGGNGTILHYSLRHSLSASILTHPEWGQVTVEPDLAWYDDGTTVTLTAEAIEGRMWMGWEGDVDPNDRYTHPLTITMDSDKMISTSFKCGFGVGPLLPVMLSVLGLFVWVRRSR